VTNKASVDTPRFQRLRSVLVTRPHSRTGLYRLAAAHPGLFRKLGRNIIVDTELLGEIEAALPTAAIKPDRHRDVPVTAAELTSRQAKR
jgi:hypothetical protein